ncbi:unnamed protein product [Sphagnum balticum]
MSKICCWLRQQRYLPQKILMPPQGMLTFSTVKKMAAKPIHPSLRRISLCDSSAQPTENNNETCKKLLEKSSLPPQHVEMVAKDFQSTCKIILQSPPSFPARCLHKMSFVPKLGSQIWYATPVWSRYTPKQRNSQEETLNARIPSTKQEAKHECFSDTNCREYYLSNLQIDQLQLQNPSK